MPTVPRARPRAWRWIRRLVIALVTLVVVAVAAVMITIHTEYGRALIRDQVEARLDATFAGGAEIGAIEGSPLGTLVLRDLVINGPDGRPAITIGTLTLELGLWPLLSRHVRLTRVVAEDVEVVLGRDEAGALELASLLAPSEGGGPGWSVALPELEVRRAHVAYDTGTAEGWNNLDRLTFHGAVHLPANAPVAVTGSLRGAWRERAVEVGLAAVVRADQGVITIPSAIAQVGGVTIAGQAIRIVVAEGRSPVVDGVVVVAAPAGAIARLVPGVELPADLAVAITASRAAAITGPPPPPTRLSVVGQLGGTPLRGMLVVEPEAPRARGVLAASAIELAELSRGGLEGTPGAVVMFEVAPSETGGLPDARGVMITWGRVGALPDAAAAIAFATGGERGATVIGLSASGVQAMLSGELRQRGDTIVLERARVRASARHLDRATGGRVPVHGSLALDASLHGALWPAPSLTVSGTVTGHRLRALGLSASALALALEVRELPRRPIGRARLTLRELAREGRSLGRLVELDALVRSPGAGDTFIVDLQRHHVHTASAGSWRGTTGRLEIDPRRVVLRELRSTSAHGELAGAGSWVRAGAQAGALTARLEVTDLALEQLGTAYRGTVDAHVDVRRTKERWTGEGQWTGEIELHGRRLGVDGSPQTFDLDTTIAARADTLVVAGQASAPRLGAATFAVEVEAPEDLTAIAAWRRLDRAAIRTGHLTLANIELARVAELAGQPARVAGRLEAALQLSAASLGGVVRVRDVQTPELRGLGEVDAELRLSQAGAGALASTLVGTLGEVGRMAATAELELPARLFDPAAWRARGRQIIRGGSLRIEDVALEPALLARLGLVTPLRGRVTASAKLAAGLRGAELAVAAREVRGGVLAEPVAADLDVAIDGHATTSALVIKARGVTLLELHGRAPISLAQLTTRPRSIVGAPLALTATIPAVQANTLLRVLGRAEVEGGVVYGVISVDGTVGDPRATARLVGARIQVPSPRYQEVQAIERIVVDASWDGTTGRLAIDGRQRDGSLRLVAAASPGALDQGTLALEARAFDLLPLLVFAPGAVGGSAGRLDADLTVTGLEPGTARLAGELHVRGGRLPITPEIGTLRRARIDLVAGARELTLAVDGKLGPGDVKARGSFAIEGARPTTGTVALTLRGVSPILGVEPVIDAEIAATLERDGSLWRADVAVNSGRIEVPKRGGEPLKPVGAPDDMVFVGDGAPVVAPTPARPTPAAPALVARIRIHALHVESPEARGLLAGTLTATARAAGVELVGTVAAERGVLELFGRRYQVARAAARFDGSTDPMLELRITHDFPGVTTVTEVRGRLSSPELVMSSSPGTYSQGQLLGFLLGGEPNGEPARGGIRDRATDVGASLIANAIGGYVRDALPVDLDVLRYEAASETESAAIAVGTWLTRTLFIAYLRRLDARPNENSNQGEIQYWISRRVMVEGVFGDRGYNGIDLLWHKRY